MFNKIKKYINDNEFRMTIFKDKVYITNYTEIVSLESNRIIILIPSSKIIVTGSNLYLNKLLDKEVLISGKVSNIEVDTSE